MDFASSSVIMQGGVGEDLTSFARLILQIDSSVLSDIRDAVRYDGRYFVVSRPVSLHVRLVHGT